MKRSWSISRKHLLEIRYSLEIRTNILENRPHSDMSAAGVCWAKWNVTLRSFISRQCSWTYCLEKYGDNNAIKQTSGGSIRGERANLKGLVIGCIEAKFCNKICVGKLSTRSTQCTPLHRSQSSFYKLKIAENFANFAEILPKFSQISLNSWKFR